ncbi:hypothetical protein RHMOL_Rhmol09G0201000 [Rhododendron molle]|uniref:Uncharacterized protein n=1 Tax=Rhododendron molle TaxID=49168 RepID=A0ACC0MFJ2_RHOML|nr:hypothetical protein RHMOL_Rhmol09G0201000 [Rhododendron molle]
MPLAMQRTMIKLGPVLNEGRALVSSGYDRSVFSHCLVQATLLKQSLRLLLLM